MSLTSRIIFFLLVASLLAAPCYAESFNEALEAAYAHNPRIAAERSRQEATDEGVSQALSNLRPNIGANYQVGKQNNAINNGSDINGTYQNQSLSISEPLFRGGGTWASYQSAKQQVKAGQYQLSGIEQQVLLQAVTAYMDVVQNYTLLDIARENQETIEKQLGSAQDKFKVGEATRTDVAQAQSRLSAAKAQVIQSEGNVLAAIALYERVMGHKPEGALTMPEKMPELPASLNEAIDVARSANPQLLSSIHAAKSAHYDVDVNAATILPQVSLVGTMNRQYGMGIPGESQFSQDRIGINVSIPIYQSGVEYSRVREAESTARQRQQQSMDTQLGVDQQVTQSWQQLQTAVASTKMREDRIADAQASVEGIREERASGTRTEVEVLDAEQELFTAKTDLARVQHDRVVAAYTLALNLGRLTPESLNLKMASYDAGKHYDSVKFQPIGF